MKIFLKYIAKCMIEKKSRLILLLLSIAMSSGLLITIVGATDIFLKSFEKPMIEGFEGKDVYVKSKDNETFINIDDIKEEGIEEIRGEIQVPGKEYEREDSNIVVHGRENKYIVSDDIIEGSLDEFTSNEVIISKRISEEKELDVTDKINIIIGGKNQEFEVVAIVKNDGIFYSDSENQFNIIVPYKYISNQLKVEGKYNSITAKKTNENLEKSIEEFEESNGNFEIVELYNLEAIKSQLNSITKVLYAMLAIVVLMSVIIIYGSFKLTITERLATVGTFLSQGATSTKVEKILILESLIYGFIGGGFGCLIGLGGLYLINYVTSPLSKYGIVENLTINISNFAIGIIFAIVLSIISALIPVLKIRKLQVKDVILNNVKVEMRIGWKKAIVGIVLLIFSSVVAFTNSEWTNSLSPICILLSIIGVILVYPKIIDIISGILYKFFRGRSKTIVFSLNNLRTSKILMGNITLIVISMISIFMITSMSEGLTKLVVEGYSGFNYDISVGSIQGIVGLDDTQSETVTDKIIKQLKQNKDVKSNTIIELNRIPVKSVTSEDGKNKASAGLLEASNLEEYREYNGYLDFKNKANRTMYNNFLTESVDENKIIISEKISKETESGVNDKLKLNIDGIEKTFEILGVYDGKMLNSGYSIIMDKKVLEREFNIKEANEIVFKVSGDIDEVKKNLLPDLKEFGVKIATRQETEKANDIQNQTILKVLSIFSYLAIFIAALGVLNNITIGFLQRKKEIAILESVGMTKGNRNRMLIFESVLSVIWSNLIALLYSFLELKLLEKVLKLVGMPLKIDVSFQTIPVYFLASLIIIVLATIPIIFKSKKLSIVSELKYE